MLNEKLYAIGNKYNLITKYNIDYDRLSTLNYVCAIHITDILGEEYPLSDEQRNKLLDMFSKLIVL